MLGKLLALAFVFTSMLAVAPRAQTTTWNGSTSSLWTDAPNWSAGVPTATVNAVLTTAGTSPRITAGAAGDCASLTLQTNATLIVGSTGSLRVRNDLTVGTGARLTLNATAATRVDDDIVATGTIALATGHDLEFGGDATVQSTITGDGRMKFLGGTQTLIAQNGASIPDLLGPGTPNGVITIRDVHVRGNLTNNEVNTLVIRGSCVVDGDCDFGTFQGDANASILVRGAATIPGNLGGLAELPPGTIRLEGNLSFPNTYDFNPQRGVIVLSGSGPQTVDPRNGTRPYDVIVESGAQVTLTATGSFQVHNVNSMQVNGSLTVAGDQTLPLAQTISIGPNGSLTYAPPAGPVPSPLVADAVDVAGALTTIGVGLDVGDLTVAATGAATLSAHDHFVSGNVSVTAGGTLSIPAGGELVLDGTGFVHGVIDGDVRVAGAYLFDGVAVPGKTVEVDGSLALINGADLALGTNGSLHVAQAGSLGLDGSPTDRASITGQNASIVLEGFLSLRLYEFAGMNSGGVLITQNATFAPAPADLRGGLFRGGQTNGVQLRLTRTMSATLRELDFQSDGTAVAKNVRVTSGAAITIADSIGDRAGEAFEVDTGDRIDWDPPGTNATSLVAHPRTHRNVLEFSTSAVDTTSFRFVRDTVPASSPVALAVIPATGVAVGSYQQIDTGLVAGTTYSYTLQRLSPFTGAWRPLSGSASARPHARDVGSARFVGPSGYPDIASALASAPAGGTVFVEAGDYNAFTVTRSVRVLGDPTGTVRIVGVMPVIAQNLPAAGGPFVLDGIDVQDAEIRLLNVADTVILHDVAITGASARGLLVDHCPEVALQQVTTARRADVTQSTLAAWSSSFGLVNLQQGSVLTRVETTGSFLPDLTSSQVVKSGIAPRLDAPLVLPVLAPQTIRVVGTAGHHWTVFVGLNHDFFDLTPYLPLDMPLLCSLTPGLWTLAQGVLDGSGRASFVLTAPDNPSSYGSAWTLQVVTADIPIGGRFGEMGGYVIVP